MSALAPTPTVGEMACGCVRDRYGMTTLCAVGEPLYAETKMAFRATLDRTVKGAAKTELVREFDRKRAAFREHIGVGA